MDALGKTYLKYLLSILKNLYSVTVQLETLNMPCRLVLPAHTDLSPNSQMAATHLSVVQLQCFLCGEELTCESL